MSTSSFELRKLCKPERRYRIFQITVVNNLKAVQTSTLQLKHVWKEPALKTSDITHPYLLLAITALIWGGNAVAGKLAVDHISPFLLTSLRWVVACALLLPFGWPYVKKDWPIIQKHLGYLFIMGFVGFTFFNNLLYLALTYTTAINAAIEQASMPILVFALNYILFRTRVTAYQIIGFMITLVGVVVTVMRGNVFDFFNLVFNRGDIIMLCATAAYGIYSVYLKYKPDLHVISFLSVLSVSALIISFPFTAYEYMTSTANWPDTKGWGVVLYAALFPSIVAQLLWVIGLGKIGSNRGGLFINLVPIFGALLAVLILGETFQTYHAIGMVLVLGGIALAQKAQKT